MRKYVILSFCLICLFILSSCANSSTDPTDSERTEYETVNYLDGVTIVVKEGTVSPSGLTVLLENDSDKPYIYGESFLLEEHIEGKWYQVPVRLDENYGFNDIGYDLAPSHVGEWAVDWEWLYGNLDTGEYRLVKDLLDARNPGDYDTYHLAAAFIIDERR